jgi:hypothetical protein
MVRFSFNVSLDGRFAPKAGIPLPVHDCPLSIPFRPFEGFSHGSESGHVHRFLPTTINVAVMRKTETTIGIFTTD